MSFDSQLPISKAKLLSLIKVIPDRIDDPRLITAVDAAQERLYEEVMDSLPDTGSTLNETQDQNFREISDSFGRLKLMLLQASDVLSKQPGGCFEPNSSLSVISLTEIKDKLLGDDMVDRLHTLVSIDDLTVPNVTIDSILASHGSVVVPMPGAVPPVKKKRGRPRKNP